MDFFLGFLVGAIVIFFYWRSVIIQAIGEVAEKIIEKQEEENQILTCNVEQHDETFLLYHADTDKFVTQGKCMQDFVNYLNTVPATQIKILNGSTEAAKALLKTGNKPNEISNNQ